MSEKRLKYKKIDYEIKTEAFDLVLNYYFFNLFT